MHQPVVIVRAPMPILKGSATFSRYRVVPSKKKVDLADALRAHAFSALEPDAQEERAQGFVELADHDATEFSPGALWQGEVAVFSYRVDEVKIPSAAVRASLDQWARKFEEENGRKPGRKEKTDAKDEIRHTLRSRYPLASKSFDVAWNQKTQVLQIWAGSRKMIDELHAAVEKALSIELIAFAPAAVAVELGLALDQLKPTPALAGDL